MIFGYCLSIKEVAGAAAVAAVGADIQKWLSSYALYRTVYGTADTARYSNSSSSFHFGSSRSSSSTFPLSLFPHLGCTCGCESLMIMSKIEKWFHFTYNEAMRVQVNTPLVSEWWWYWYLVGIFEESNLEKTLVIFGNIARVISSSSSFRVLCFFRIRL